MALVPESTHLSEIKKAITVNNVVPWWIRRCFKVKVGVEFIVVRCPSFFDFSESGRHFQQAIMIIPCDAAEYNDMPVYFESSSPAK
jgi:hypothetical protein